MIGVTHDPMTPEWYDVAEDGQPIGCYGRTEEMGIIRWVAYDAQSRRLGEFGGRGAAQQAKAAVVGNPDRPTNAEEFTAWKRQTD